MDCLDRTNIVQTAIARNILEIQFRKVGLLPPEVNLPADCRAKYQEIWANNGDALSRQYAGTAALKGDFTRTGTPTDERAWSLLWEIGSHVGGI